MLTGRDRAVADDVRIADERRHAVGAWGELIDNAAERRKQIERIAEALVVGRRGVPGEGIVSGRVVVLHRVGQRADQRDLVHLLGRLWQVLADLDLGAARRDRRERTLVAFRRVRLHVEHIDMAGPAPLEQKNHSLGPDSRPTRRLLFAGVGREEELRNG
jgi:hypothetical protein